MLMGIVWCVLDGVGDFACTYSSTRFEQGHHLAVFMGIVPVSIQVVDNRSPSPSPPPPSKNSDTVLS